MAVEGARSFRFGEVEVDLDAFEIRRDGTPVHVEPQVIDVAGVLANATVNS